MQNKALIFVCALLSFCLCFEPLAVSSNKPKKIESKIPSNLQLELDNKLNNYDLSRRSDYGNYTDNFSLYYNNFQSSKTYDTMGLKMRGQSKAMAELQQSMNGFQNFSMGPKGEGNVDVYGFRTRIPLDKTHK